MKKFLDRLLIPICFLISYLPKKEKKEECGRHGRYKRPQDIKKILVIRLYGMGDAVVLLSVLKRIKIRYKIKVSILTTNETKKIFDRSNLIDEIINWDTKPIRFIQSFFSIVYRLKKSNFDLIIDTEQFARISSLFSFLPKTRERIGYKGLGRDRLYTIKIKYDDKKHTAETFADLFRKKFKVERIEEYQKLDVKESSLKKIEKFFLENNIRKEDLVIGIHPGTGATGKIRRWPAEKYIELINEINKIYKNVKIILIGSETEREVVEYIYNNTKIKPLLFFGESFDSFIALLSKIDLFIGNDSGPMHLAAAMNTKTISLFGPNTPIRWAPLGDHYVIYKNFPCSPCINTHLGVVPSECPIYSTPKCMEAIEVEEVIQKVKDAIKIKKVNS